jgi:very-short-patch-repair endonuclease
MLTPMQKRVVQQLVLGHSNKIIAYNLGMEEATVKVHLIRILDSKTKLIHARWPSEKREEWERKRQAELLAQKSEAVEARCSALRGVGISDFRKEERVRAFGNTYFIDVWCPTQRIAWEADGSHHRNTKPRDRGRDEDITAVMKCRVVRNWNSFYLTGDLKQKVLNIIGDHDRPPPY